MAYNFAETADKILDLQDRVDVIKTAAAAKTKPLEEQIEELEQELILAMRDANLMVVTGKKSSAELKEPIRVQIQDFESFAAFLYRRKALHLMERRVGIKAYEEMKTLLGNKPIPGLNEVKVPKLNVKHTKTSK